MCHVCFSFPFFSWLFLLSTSVLCWSLCFPVTQSVCSVCHMSPVPVCSPASVLLLMSSALHWLVLDLFVALTFVLRVFCHLPFVSFLSFLKLAFLFSYPPACVCCVWDPFCLTSRRSGSPPELAGPPSPGEQWRKKNGFGETHPESLLQQKPRGTNESSNTMFAVLTYKEMAQLEQGNTSCLWGLQCMYSVLNWILKDRTVCTCQYIIMMIEEVEDYNELELQQWRGRDDVCSLELTRINVVVSPSEQQTRHPSQFDDLQKRRTIF